MDNASQLLKGTNRSDPASYYSYNELHAKLREAGVTGKNTGFEAHHLLSKQFAEKFGLSKGEIISVSLTPLNHRGSGGSKIIGAGKNINDAVQKELKKITGSQTERAAIKNATPEQIWQAHRNVYEKMGQREWAQAIYQAYVKPLGKPYK